MADLAGQKFEFLDAIVKLGETQKSLATSNCTSRKCRERKKPHLLRAVWHSSLQYVRMHYFVSFVIIFSYLFT